MRLAPAAWGLRAAEQIIGASAIAFFIILFFLHWLGGSANTPLGGIHYSASYGIKTGIWLGLIAAGALTHGGYRSMRDDAFSPGGAGVRGDARVAGMSPSETPPASAPAAPAAPVTPAPASEPQVPPPAAPAGPGEDSGPAAPPPSAEPEQPTGPPIPPPAAPAEQR